MTSPTSEFPAAPDVLVVADACLIASHRLTEWVGEAPTMEEDVALGNIALDLLGQARGLYSHLGDEDQLAYFRDAGQWRNPTICELPRGDFAFTLLRQLFVDEWLSLVWPAYGMHPGATVRGVAEKAVKENAYHLRHSRSWVVRLGDGTEESRGRMLAALDALRPYAEEIASPQWETAVAAVLADAGLADRGAAAAPPPQPTGPVPRSSRLRRLRGAAAAPGVPQGSLGKHTPHLVELLEPMQSLARAHPGATW